MLLSSDMSCKKNHDKTKHGSVRIFLKPEQVQRVSMLNAGNGFVRFCDMGTFKDLIFCLKGLLEQVSLGHAVLSQRPQLHGNFALFLMQLAISSTRVTLAQGLPNIILEQKKNSQIASQQSIICQQIYGQLTFCFNYMRADLYLKGGVLKS